MSWIFWQNLGFMIDLETDSICESDEAHLLCIAFVQIGQEMALSGNSLLTPCPREMLKNGVYAVNLSGNLSVFAILKKKKTSGGNSLVFVILMICVGAPPFQSPATALKNKKNRKKENLDLNSATPQRNGPNTDLPVPSVFQL